MIAIIDYGAGNMFSLRNALDFLGMDNAVAGEESVLRAADKLILPGVGAFPDAMRMLNERGLVDVIKEDAARKPLLGICLGMQMLFDRSFEFGETRGLGLIGGSVKLMEPQGLAIPHMGWNALEKNADCGLSDSFNEGEYVYFVHSYAAQCDGGNVAAYCDYGGKIPALVFGGNVCGCQFHPEKSGEAGLGILKKFCERTV
jgi:glutamine amidotransferase